MIPSIGIMIGAYIVLRCFEIALCSESHWASKSSRPLMIFLAIAVALLAGTSTVSLMATGSDAAGVLGGLK